jgi:CheY-like chemotaxis protein
MSRKVLIIGETGGFLFKAIVNGLTSNGYQVETLDSSLETVYDDVPEILILYLSDIMITKMNIFKKINELMMNGANTSLYVIGSQNELDETYLILNKDFVKGVFQRPINIQEISQRFEEDAIKGTDLEFKKKILLVDDDTIALRTMELWLSDKYRVFIANSGTDAIDFLRNKTVDLILLDYEMPVLSGPQVMRSIQNNPAIAKTPIMFLTSKNDMDSVRRAVTLKPVRYLLKSMPKETLIEIIDGFFAEKG